MVLYGVLANAVSQAATMAGAECPKRVSTSALNRMWYAQLAKAVEAKLLPEGFNLAEKSLHGNQAVLDRAHAVCEQVCPGINMPSAWKPLDFTVKSMDKLELIKNPDGSVKEVRVPADYEAPAAGSAAAGEELGSNRPSYEEMREGFSLGLRGQYGKVGSTYIKKAKDGALTVFNAGAFKEAHKHLACWELKGKKG